MREWPARLEVWCLETEGQGQGPPQGSYLDASIDKLQQRLESFFSRYAKIISYHQEILDRPRGHKLVTLGQSQTYTHILLASSVSKVLNAFTLDVHHHRATLHTLHLPGPGVAI